MVLGSLFDWFGPSIPNKLVDDGRQARESAMDSLGSLQNMTEKTAVEDVEVDHELARPPYIHAILAGGIGGTTGDMLMHSLDTVKTRQQGDPHMPPKYTSMGNTYHTIWRQEGITRGLYGGVQPAFVGSFLGTCAFFGTYEWSKRLMIDYGVAPSVSYFTAVLSHPGLVADLAAAPVYVPSEVLKTRLQLQGRHNNPYFNSGYNYRSTLDAARTIARSEGFGALFYGYKATLWRDLPFSALQFAFYEEERQWAKDYMGSNNIGLPLEILTAASAGGMAATEYIFRSGAASQGHIIARFRLKTRHIRNIEQDFKSVKSPDIHIRSLHHPQSPRRRNARYLVRNPRSPNHIPYRRNLGLFPRCGAKRRVDERAERNDAGTLPDAAEIF
ncbi:hypothetical protein GRF29_185g1074790 [Pseudopithomyces chartarum]|uniref:Mitochondrial carrier protein n=1 Tax=Pseudopithomyces chartarum TaxID=1892770 RepID=A0AAN6LRK0_9PLEO|nr:hypothetical protein GRF29_185g1074790 [Pseudopithomyces chartarum]